MPHAKVKLYDAGTLLVLPIAPREYGVIRIFFPSGSPLLGILVVVGIRKLRSFSIISEAFWCLKIVLLS